MFCHNKPLFRARSEGLGCLAHSVYGLDLKCACVSGMRVSLVMASVAFQRLSGP